MKVHHIWSLQNILKLPKITKPGILCWVNGSQNFDNIGLTTIGIKLTTVSIDGIFWPSCHRSPSSQLGRTTSPARVLGPALRLAWISFTRIHQVIIHYEPSWVLDFSISRTRCPKFDGSWEECKFRDVLCSLSLRFDPPYFAKHHWCGHNSLQASKVCFLF